MNVSTLKLLNPPYESLLINAVIELEYLRRLHLRSTTPLHIFYQLKDIFHFLESLGSARIEGNHTTISDYVEAKLKDKTSQQERFLEIENIENALTFVEENLPNEINHAFVRTLHKLVVQNLSLPPKGEGDPSPGQYRDCEVRIDGATHTPPHHVSVHALMEELLEYLNRKDDSKYDLIKIALIHHRFCWIHPFRNGNGRVVRLLTYASLLKFGFQVKVNQGRLLNPTAVFCNDRDKYYQMLGVADRGDDPSLEEWCTYVLDGLRNEFKKLDMLADYEYLKTHILLPAVKTCHDRTVISAEEKTILEKMLNTKFATIQSGDFATAFSGKNSRQRAYMIKKLIERKIIHPIRPKARTYTLSFVNNKLLYNVVEQLIKNGFAPNLDKAVDGK